MPPTRPLPLIPDHIGRAVDEAWRGMRRELSELPLHPEWGEEDPNYQAAVIATIAALVDGSIDHTPEAVQAKFGGELQGYGYTVSADYTPHQDDPEAYPSMPEVETDWNAMTPEGQMLARILIALTDLLSAEP